MVGWGVLPSKDHHENFHGGWEKFQRSREAEGIIETIRKAPMLRLGGGVRPRQRRLRCQLLPAAVPQAARAPLTFSPCTFKKLEPGRKLLGKIKMPIRSKFGEHGARLVTRPPAVLPANRFPQTLGRRQTSQSLPFFPYWIGCSRLLR